MTKRYYSLRQAAEYIGVDRHTVRRWLAEDLGIIVPRVKRGAKVLVAESDLEKLIARRRDARASR